MTTERTRTDAEKREREFDPDVSPTNPHNRDAAKAHGLRWDAKRGYYVDEDGCLIRDSFGQLL